jgi:hypothetical protein
LVANLGRRNANQHRRYSSKADAQSHQEAAVSIRIPLCPAEGEGVNRWTFNSVCKLFRSRWSEHRIRSYLHEHTTRRGSQAEAEIERAIERAPEWIKAGRAKSQKKWPKANAAKREEVLGGGGGVKELQFQSPTKQAAAQDVLPILFPNDPLIWAGRSVRPEIADTLPLGLWLPVAGMQQFIVPNPMISRDIPKNGKSRRCLTNTGRRFYLVVESDTGTADEQAGILWHLARFASLVMAVHSANKSVHGWFHVANRSERQNRAFMEYAVLLGSDSATFSKCQAVRMPGGHRPNKGKQEILFFNPAAIGGAQ